MSPPPSPDSSSIPVVVIGWGRENGVVFVPKTFTAWKTPYQMTAMIDFIGTLPQYRYSTHNLAVVLHNLHPRPRALIIGIAVDPSLVGEITGVWNEYVDTVLKEEFKVNDEWRENGMHYVDPKTTLHPPGDIGWEKEMFKQLDAVFRPEV